MLFQKIQKILIAGVLTLFLLFTIGGSIFVLASEQSALEQKTADLDRIEQEWQKYQEQIEVKYSGRISRNQERLDELRRVLEDDLQAFEGSRQEVAAHEEALRNIETRLGTLQGQLELLARQLKKTESEIFSIQEQIVIRETRLGKVMEEKQDIAAEADLQRDTVLSYFSLLQTESDTFTTPGANGLRILLSSDSFSKNLRDEMHFTALEETARQLFHDLEGAMAQKEEIEYLLAQERKELTALHSRLETERRSLAVQKNAQQQLFEETLGEEQRFQELLAESKRQLESSSQEITNVKADMAYIQAQLNLLEERKSEDEESLSKEKIQELIENEDENFEIGELFLLREQEEKPFSWPVEPLKITAPFKDPGYEAVFNVEHNAIDIRASQGTPIRAPAPGYVYKTVDNGMGYSYISLIHKDNFITVYGHVSGFAVKEGDLVQEGDLIGYTGGTPGTKGAGLMTTGPHLHFEVWKDGIVQNPLDYLPLEYLQPEDIPKEYLLEELE